MKLNFKIDPAEIVAMRAVRSLIAKRKWREGYRAVDELRYVRARLLEGEQANFSTLPATVTSLAEWRVSGFVAACFVEANDD